MELDRSWAARIASFFSLLFFDHAMERERFGQGGDKARFFRTVTRSMSCRFLVLVIRS